MTNKRGTCVYAATKGNCSDDLLAVHSGRPAPTFLCGYHEMRFGIPQPGSAESAGLLPEWDQDRYERDVLAQNQRPIREPS